MTEPKKEREREREREREIERKLGPFRNFERKKLQRLYTQGGAPNGSVRNSLEASNLPVSKVKEILSSNIMYRKFTLTPRKHKRSKEFAIFKYKLCWMDLTYVDNKAKDIIGVKYLLVRQDLFDGTEDAKKNKSSHRNNSCIFGYDYEKESTQKSLGWHGTGFAGEFKKPCEAEGIQI